MDTKHQRKIKGQDSPVSAEVTQTGSVPAVARFVMAHVAKNENCGTTDYLAITRTQIT